MKILLALALVFIGTVATWGVLNIREEIPVQESMSETSLLEMKERGSTEERGVQSGPQVPQYYITLEFQPTQKQLTGNSSITVWNRSDVPTNQIFVNIFLNAFQDGTQPVLPEFRKRAYPNGIQHGSMDIQNISVDGERILYEVKGTSLIITLNDNWDPGEMRNIQIEWAAFLPQIHHRVGMNNDAFWFGNILPILAVFDGAWVLYDYQAIGDPFFSEVADYKLEVTMPAAYHLYSTGNETEVKTNQSRIVTIEASQVREMAFAITANHALETTSTKSGVQVNLYYRNASKSQAETTVRRAAAMLEYLEQRVGQYPYDEIDIFENEMFITGMEYPGIVFIQSDRLQSKNGYQTVLHEIAHQWFYNVVGNNQITEPWLDEGLATYLVDEFEYGNQIGGFYSDQQKEVEHHGAEVIMGDVRSYGKWSMYWTANYRKSSLMIYALRKKLGEEQFSRFIQDYYESNKYKIATGVSFASQAQNYTREPLGVFFEEWIGEELISDGSHVTKDFKTIDRHTGGLLFLKDYFDSVNATVSDSWVSSSAIDK